MHNVHEEGTTIFLQGVSFLEKSMSSRTQDTSPTFSSWDHKCKASMQLRAQDPFSYIGGFRTPEGSFLYTSP